MFNISLKSTIDYRLSACSVFSDTFDTSLAQPRAKNLKKLNMAK